jgi:septal ring factor EnvC (AmiA/AmiB activator)
MTDEERQRAMDFIVEQQAKFSVDIEQLNGSYRKSEHRFDRYERILKLMVKAGRRTRRQIREMDERFEQRFAKLTDALTTLAEGQAHTDRRLDALIDIVREGRNGRS